MTDRYDTDLVIAEDEQSVKWSPQQLRAGWDKAWDERMLRHVLLRRRQAPHVEPFSPKWLKIDV